MKETTISLNGTKYTAHYEFEEGEQSTSDYPGSNPRVRLWCLYDADENDVTTNLTTLQWDEVETQCFNNSID